MRKIVFKFRSGRDDIVIESEMPRFVTRNSIINVWDGDPEIPASKLLAAFPVDALDCLLFDGSDDENTVVG